jgi:hypothetical protein
MGRRGPVDHWFFALPSRLATHNRAHLSMFMPHPPSLRTQTLGLFLDKNGDSLTHNAD